MWFEGIYKVGKANSFFPKIKSIDEKFELIQFPYTSSNVISGMLIFLAIFGSIGLLFMFFVLPMVPLMGWSIIFYTIVIGLSSFVYATGVYYSQRMIDYKEEMLHALLDIGNYISLGTSMEYALIQSNKNLKGVLYDQFTIIIENIKRKKWKTLREGFEYFIPTWLKVNPDFVKALSLLQTAEISLPEDREVIIRESIETIIQSYYEQGKRFTEELSSQTQGLIALGVIFPMMLLMMVPMISVFLPDVINLPMLIFAFDIFFPTVLLLLAMQFAANRIQVSTIRLEDAPEYKKIPPAFFIIPAILIVVFAFPAFLHFSSLQQFLVIEKEYSVESIFIIWLSVVGIFLAVEIITYAYIKKYKKLWNRIYEVEQDLPHLLQVLSTYLSLNRSFESILGDVIDDYERHGFKDHPVTGMLSEINERLYRTKKTIVEIVQKTLPKINPSKRVNAVFQKIVGFTDVDLLQAAKSSKMIRQQTLSIYKLDDYIRTLLADTLSLVYATVAIMAPLLSSIAIIMAMAIVMSLTFIQERLQRVFELFGGHIDLGLVKLEKIIPPTILEFVIGIYFIEMVLILSLFLSYIKFGTDKFKIAETVNKNMLVAFLLYSVLLLGGYFVFRVFVFEGIITTETFGGG